MSYKVFIDPGHGGNDPGACANGLQEKALNLVTAIACKELLEKNGVTVVTSRTTDSAVPLTTRATLSNNAKADLFVSIHHNAGGGDGVECIYSVVGGESKALASTLVNAVSSYTGQNKRPTPTYCRWNDTRTGDLFTVIARTSAPAVILECAFLDSPDHKIVDTVDKQKDMGRAIAKGVLEYLNINIEESKEPVVPAKERVCVGSYTKENYADDLLRKLGEKGMYSYKEWVDSLKVYRVFISGVLRTDVESIKHKCIETDTAYFIVK